MQGSNYPYKNIGQKLRQWRENVHESLAEVSGAVEIDADLLRNIEAGEVLPSEDILLLLVSHLDIQESEAKKLFEQAGYSAGVDSPSASDEQLIKQMLMIIPFDNRVLYSDVTNVSSNPNGVVLDFMQQTGDKQQSVARIGMSQEHLERLSALLTQTLSQMKSPKKFYLPAPQNKTKRSEKHKDA